MRHISVISRKPVVADSQDVQYILQTIFDVVGFIFEMFGAFETAFSTISTAILELKGTTAE